MELPEGLFKDAALVFVATGCKGADAAWHSVAKSEGALVNVVDYPELCDAYTPSIVDRDPVVIAIGTEGTAPVLGRQIKSKIDQMLEPNLGHFARICGDLRDEVAQRIERSKRRIFWRWVFGGPPRQSFARGAERTGVAQIKDAISDAGPRSFHPEGSIHRVTADPHNPDLISLRDAHMLQEADVICFDDETLESVLEYARRDATRRFVGADDPEVVNSILDACRTNGEAVVLVCRQKAIENIIDLSTKRLEFDRVGRRP